MYGTNDVQALLDNELRALFDLVQAELKRRGRPAWKRMTKIEWQARANKLEEALREYEASMSLVRLIDDQEMQWRVWKQDWRLLVGARKFAAVQLEAIDKEDK